MQAGSQHFLQKSAEILTQGIINHADQYAAGGDSRCSAIVLRQGTHGQGAVVQEDLAGIHQADVMLPQRTLISGFITYSAEHRTLQDNSEHFTRRRQLEDASSTHVLHSRNKCVAIQVLKILIHHTEIAMAGTDGRDDAFSGVVGFI